VLVFSEVCTKERKKQHGGKDKSRKEKGKGILTFYSHHEKFSELFLTPWENGRSGKVKWRPDICVRRGRSGGALYPFRPSRKGGGGGQISPWSLNAAAHEREHLYRNQDGGEETNTSFFL